MNNNKPLFLYHGSKTHGIKKLVPNTSTHGKYVYATKDINIAIIMSKSCGSDMTYTLKGNKNGTFDLVERIPDAFNKMFNNSFSVYLLSPDGFIDKETGFNEVMSDKPVDVLFERKYNNLNDEIQKLVNKGLINIYYYPNRPEYIPDDDSDLIEKIIRYDEIGLKTTENEYMRWIFYHPNIEDKIRQIALDKGISLPSYDEIKAIMIKKQEDNPDKEEFIDCAEKIKSLFDNTRK